MLKSLSIFLYYGKSIPVRNEKGNKRNMEKEKLVIIGWQRGEVEESVMDNIEGLLEISFGLKMKNKGAYKKLSVRIGE